MRYRVPNIPLWLDEPDEIRKIRWGVIDSGAGTGRQSFSLLVHLEAYLMLVGADVILVSANN